MPKRIASAKPRITSPPITASGKIDRNTVSDVTSVRPRVWLMLRSISCRSGRVVFAEIFPDAVVDDDLVGDRIADQRQQGRDRGKIELKLGDPKKPDRLGNIEDQSSDDADPKLPLEAKPDVDQHRDQGSPVRASRCETTRR